MKLRTILLLAFCHSAFLIPHSAFAQTPTPTPTPTATPGKNIVNVDTYKAGTNQNAILRCADNGDGTCTLEVSSSGGGAGGLTDTQLRATPVPVAQTGAQYTIAITVATTGATIAAGKHHIEFILSSDFAGTIAGAAIDPAIVGVYDPGAPPVGSTFAALIYTISAGSATITTW